MDIDPSSEVFEIESAGGEYDIFITRWSQVPDAVSALPFPTPVTVFPNPASGRFSLDLGAVYSGVEVEITTLAGQVVQRQSYPFAKTMQVEIRSKAGIYLTIIRDNQGRKAIFKIIKL